MKNLLPLAVLLVSAPTGTLSLVCNADNVLRALRRFTATSFCSTYTLAPTGQPLPTYVSDYPASRVSSGCSCLNSPTPTALTTATASSTSTFTTTNPTITSTTTSSSTTSTTPSPTFTSTTTSTTTTTTTTTTPSPTPSYFPPPGQVCQGELIRNGGFEELTNGIPYPWILAPPTDVNGKTTGVTVQQSTTSPPNTNVHLSVSNGPVTPPSSYYATTYIKQYIPDLCYGSTYTLSFSSQISITGGMPGLLCSVYFDIAAAGRVAYIGPPSGFIPPFSYQDLSTTFQYLGPGTRNTNSLTVTLSCNAPGGGFTIDNVSLVGT